MHIKVVSVKTFTNQTPYNLPNMDEFIVVRETDESKMVYSIIFDFTNEVIISESITHGYWYDVEPEEIMPLIDYIIEKRMYIRDIRAIYDRCKNEKYN